MSEEYQKLYQEIEALKDEITQIKARSQEYFVTPAELAELMQCSLNTVYVKIRAGEIYATRKTGYPRIPMSQFYKTEPVDLLKRKPAKSKKSTNSKWSMEELVFGKGEELRSKSRNQIP